MTIKKFTVIAVAGAALLAGALGISMKLTQPHEMEMEVAEQTDNARIEETAEDVPKTLENMENTPLYYDDREILLLPLRNVMEGLGGSVIWNKEDRMTEISYRDRKLQLKPGETEATLNGYEITLPKAAEMINGCLYADEEIISAYYTGDVLWNHDSRQITLQAKDHTIPVVAFDTLTGGKGNKSYHIEVPVVLGLNDVNFEKSLNENMRQELQAMGEAFLQEGLEENEEAVTVENKAEFQLELHTELTARGFLSFWWDGRKGDVPQYFAKNIDLTAQKTVTLKELLTENSLQEIYTVAEEGWTEECFYLTQEGMLVLLKKDAENQLERHYWPQEGNPLQWRKAYQDLLE